MAVPSRSAKMKHHFVSANAADMKKKRGTHESSMSAEDKQKEILALMEKMKNMQQ